LSEILFKKNTRAFTAMELVVVCALILLVTSLLFITVDPYEAKKKARDNIRLMDISDIERVVNEYKIDHNVFPGERNVLYISNDPDWLPIPSITAYISHLPIDPINKNGYVYSYIQDGDSYEVTSKLEYFTNFMDSDKGNDLNMFESGTNLSLIKGN